MKTTTTKPTLTRDEKLDAGIAGVLVGCGLVLGGWGFFAVAGFFFADAVASLYRRGAA